jgi:phosphate transport system protein
MRESFHQQLGNCGRDVSTMATLAADALRCATLALLEADPDRAVEAVGFRDAVAGLHTAFDTCVLEILACQQPVACDLRLLFAWLRISADLDGWAASRRTSPGSPRTATRTMPSRRDSSRRSRGWP